MENFLKDEESEVMATKEVSVSRVLANPTTSWVPGKQQKSSGFSGELIKFTPRKRVVERQEFSASLPLACFISGYFG